MKVTLVLLMLAAMAAAQSQVPSTYLLGSDDTILVRALDVEEFDDKPVRIDMRGNINLPLVGRVRAAGLTLEELEADIVSKLKTFLHEPQVTVSMVEYRSQPVSVLGAVTEPGVHQVQGRKTLFEMLSLAGGLRQDAGNIIKITRRKEWGAIALPTAAEDPTGQFSVAEVKVRSVMDARNPEENIQVMPHDVISVPRADLVYVIGEVQRAGGFVFTESGALSVLQALSLAGGLGRTAAPHKARVLRMQEGSAERQEIALNLRDILAGKAQDVQLVPEDILFIPNNTGRTIALRAIEAAINTGSGVMIWRGGRF